MKRVRYPAEFKAEAVKQVPYQNHSSEHSGGCSWMNLAAMDWKRNWRGSWPKIKSEKVRNRAGRYMQERRCPMIEKTLIRTDRRLRSASKLAFAAR